jgi:hypothetical protein
MVIFQSYRQNYKRVYITIPIYRQRLQPISETHTLESTILNLKYKRVGCRMILFPLKITSPKIALPHFWSPQKFESSHLHPPNSPPSSEANISPAGHTGPGRAVRPVHSQQVPNGWTLKCIYIYIIHIYICSCHSRKVTIILSLVQYDQSCVLWIWCRRVPWTPLHRRKPSGALVFVLRLRSTWASKEVTLSMPRDPWQRYVYICINMYVCMYIYIYV